MTQRGSEEQLAIEQALQGQTKMKPDTSVRAGGKNIVRKLHSFSSYKLKKKTLLIRKDLTQHHFVNLWEQGLKSF